MLSYNRLDFTKRAIAALREMTDHPYKLVVVDNGSDEDTVAWLKEAKRDGRIDILLLNDENRGVAPAANQGWQALDAPYYVKLDNDIVLTKRSWLSALVHAANTLPDAGMVGYNFEEQSYPLAARAGLRVRPRPVHLGGACVLIAEPAHAIAGYWCEDYLPYSEEDFDMGYRLERAGFSHYYMEDEDAGLHLPHGRATPLVDGTASDDEGDPEYREFKDEARHKHIGFFSTVWINRLQYDRGLRPLYYRPGPQRHSLRLRCETALFKTLRLAWTAFRPGR
jgi:GT2 family glycosyltransferase